MTTIKVEVMTIDLDTKTTIPLRITMIWDTRVEGKLTNAMARNLTDIQNHILGRARTNMLRSSIIHLPKSILKISLTLNQEKSNTVIRDCLTTIRGNNHTAGTILALRNIHDIEKTLNNISLATRKILYLKISRKTKTYYTKKSPFKVDSPLNKKSLHLRKNPWMFNSMSIDPFGLEFLNINIFILTTRVFSLYLSTPDSNLLTLIPFIYPKFIANAKLQKNN